MILKDHKDLLPRIDAGAVFSGSRICALRIVWVPEPRTTAQFTDGHNRSQETPVRDSIRGACFAGTSRPGFFH